jgi:hypothetical protein
LIAASTVQSHRALKSAIARQPASRSLGHVYFAGAPQIKTAPVRARVCAVSSGGFTQYLVEDSHRRP